MAIVLQSPASLIAEQYNVTQEQIDRCDRITDYSRHKVFYQVESQTDSTLVYHVEYSNAHHVLTCTCKAGQYGIPCWHKRAALAAEEVYKQEIAQRRAEQEQIERDEAYQFEQMLHDLEESQAELEAYQAELDKREAQRCASLELQAIVSRIPPYEQVVAEYEQSQTNEQLPYRLWGFILTSLLALMFFGYVSPVIVVIACLAALFQCY